MFIIAIDPGISTGIAIFRNRTLLHAANTEPWDFSEVGRAAKGARAVIEVPHVYPSRLAKGDPNNLITLAVRVGRYARHLETLGATVGLVEPATWKGQLAKPVHHARARARVSEAEGRLWDHYTKGLTAKAKLDVGDAICLGLWALGRLPLSGR